MKLSVLNGADTLARTGGFLKGKRLGLITNQSGALKDVTATLDLLHEKYDLRALYSPEHGVRGDAQAGEKIETRVDPLTGIPAYSIYGGGGELTEENTKDVDMILCDIQDQGIRFTTYMYTVTYSMAYCKKHNIPFTVLDRIGPLGGAVEGNLLDERFRSFVGDYSLPTRYGLTLGELARYLAGTRPEEFGCDLTVVPVEGWRRDTYYDETDIPWINPSPNLPTMDTLVVYLGNCVFEGTNLSEGRGTTIPFQIIGAPWLKEHKVAEAMNDMHLPGVRFRAGCFTPTFSKHKGELCRAVQTHVTDRREYRAVETGLKLLEVIRDMHPKDFSYLSWDGGKTYFLDLLMGTDRFRTGAVDAEGLLAQDAPGLEAYKEAIKPYLLYE